MRADLLLAAQLRRLACILLALTIVTLPVLGAIPVSVPVSVLVMAGGLLAASRAIADILAA